MASTPTTAASSAERATPSYESQTPEQLITFVNSRLGKTNPTMDFLNGRVLSFDPSTLSAKVVFRTHDQLSNGANQVQGGFSAAMLDASCAYLVMIHSKLTKVISTLEQKQTYIKPVPLNADLVCTSHILRIGRDVVFFEANLALAAKPDDILVTASQTALLVGLVKKQQQAKI